MNCQTNPQCKKWARIDFSDINYLMTQSFSGYGYLRLITWEPKVTWHGGETGNRGQIFGNYARPKITLEDACRKTVSGQVHNRKKWRCTSKILLWIYTAIVRPMNIYGVVIWVEKTELHTQAKELHKFQRLTCVCITGTITTCPTVSLVVLAGLTLPHLNIQM